MVGHCCADCRRWLRFWVKLTGFTTEPVFRCHNFPSTIAGNAVRGFFHALYVLLCLIIRLVVFACFYVFRNLIVYCLYLFGNKI